MKKILVLCIMFGGYLSYAEGQPIMIQELSDSPISIGYPWVESITEMPLHSQINTRELAERIEIYKRQNTVLEKDREAPRSDMLSHFPKQPDFSPFTLNEFLVDTSRYPSIAPGVQRYPVIAFGGTNFMAVWSDGSRHGLVGARIATHDTVLDKPAFLISQDYRGDADIVFDGTNYFVTWCTNGGVYGARITPDGIVLDPNGFLIANSVNPVRSAVDYGDGIYLVSWEEYVFPYAIWGARVDTNGTVLDVFPIMADAVYLSTDPDVSFNGTNFLVVFYGYSPNRVWGKRIAPDGTILDPYPIQISQQPSVLQPVVDFDGTNWFVVWSWLLNDLSYSWVTPDGVPFGETQHIPGSWGMWFPQVVLGDSVHWLEGVLAGGTYPPVDIYITRMDFSGNVLDSPWIPVDVSPGWQTNGATAYGDSTFIAIWEDQVNWDIYARRYAPDGNPLDSARFPVNVLRTQYQSEPSVAFDGTNYLVVYRDSRSGYLREIFGARIAQDGTLLDPEGFRITDSGYWPKIAFGDSLYLCVYNVGAYIYGARILPDGTILDPNGFQITSSGSDYCPSVSYYNGIFLVAYDHSIQGIFITRVTPAGQVLDPDGILIKSPGGQNPGWPEIAPYENGFLVTWMLYGGPDDIIEGVRVNFHGAVLDSPAIQISPPGVSGRWHGTATNGDTFLVVWDRNTTEIYGARVDSSGTVLDTAGIPICVGQPNNRTQPSVVFNGRDFLVVWQDSRQDASQYDLYGARVSPAGIVLDTNGIELVNSEYSRVNVELASATPEPDTGAQILLVFDGFVGEPYESNRALGAIYYYPLIGIKEDYVQTILTGHQITISPRISCEKPYVLSYSVPRQAEINVNVYDITGRKVKNVYNGNVKGTGQIKFDLEGMPQGTYFVRVETENRTETTKVIWLK